MRNLILNLLIGVLLVSAATGQTKQEPVPLDLDRFIESPEKKTEDFEKPSEKKELVPKKRKRIVDSPGETEVSLDYKKEYLTNDRGTWDEARLGIIHKFSKRKVLYASYSETQRFEQRDRYAMLGFYQPLDKNWTVLVEASASPTHRVLAKWAAMAQVERSLGDGWIASAGYRRTEHAAAKVNIAKFGVEKYWGLNRAAYSLSLNHLENTGTSPSQRVQYNRYYHGGASSVGVSFGFGSESETTGPNIVLQSDVYNLTVTGKHHFNRHWAIGYGFTHHKQGDIYTRRGLNLGLRYKF